MKTAFLSLYVLATAVFIRSNTAVAGTPPKLTNARCKPASTVSWSWWQKKLLFKEIEEGLPGEAHPGEGLRSFDKAEPALELERRFEVSPGEQAQVDFATFKTDFGVVYALLVVLSWSRYLWPRRQTAGVAPAA